jgi:hypothetical protein
MPGAHLAGDGFELGDLRMGNLFALAADKDALERRTIGQLLEQPLESLAIDNGDLGAGIGEAKLQLRPGPPGIEQSGDTADEQTAKERGRPFRHIAHGDGDAIAFLDAGFLERLGDGERGASEFMVAHALITVDDECFVAVRAS